MKIIANYTRHTALSVLLVAGLGLSGCVPLPYMPVQVPQADPMQAPMQGQGQPYRPQVARQMPQAPSLQANRGQNIQGAPGRPIAAGQVQQGTAQRQVIPSVQASAQRAAQMQSIPTLKPAWQPAQRPVVQRQAMVPRVNASNTTRYARPSASVSKPAATSRKRKQSRPVTSKRKSRPAKKTVRRVAAPAQKRAVRSAPAPVPQKVARPSASVKAQTQAAQTPAPVKQEVAKEVLDMSKVQAKPTASVKTVKQLPPLPPLPAARGNRNSPAVSILVKQANNDLSAGKNGRAAATLERALRISPDNATLWLRLAEVNAQQGRKAQAASMAKKAIGLAAGDESLKRRGQRLLN